jgi:hypothetical protein
VGGNEIKANSAELELELGPSLAIIIKCKIVHIKRRHIVNKDAMSFIKVLLSEISLWW